MAMSDWLVPVLVVGGLLLAAVGYLFAAARLQSQLSAEQARTEALQQALDDAKTEREQLRGAAEELRQEVTRLTARHEQQEQVITEQKDFVKKSSDALQQQFETLANRF